MPPFEDAIILSLEEKSNLGTTFSIGIISGIIVISAPESIYIITFAVWFLYSRITSSQNCAADYRRFFSITELIIEQELTFQEF